MGTTVVAALVAGDRDDARQRRRQPHLSASRRLARAVDEGRHVARVGARRESRRRMPTRSHPLRHVLTSVVGTKDDVKPESREEQLKARRPLPVVHRRRARQAR